MSYRFFEVPNARGTRSDVVYGDAENPESPCFLHYAFAVAGNSTHWDALQSRRAFPISQLRDWQSDPRLRDFASKLADGGDVDYWPGRSVIERWENGSPYLVNTALRLGALEVLANISSGRLSPNEKDPFPHQLALEHFMRERAAGLERVLIADEVGLGKTIEVGLAGPSHFR